MFATFLGMSITLMGIFLFGSLGEILTEKSGHLNLGTPGIICLGATGGMTALAIYSNICGGSANTNGILCVIIGIVGAIIFGGLGGLIYSFFCVSLKSNQNVVGLCITTLSVGIFALVNTAILKDNNVNLILIARRDFTCLFPVEWVNNTGWFGEIFLKHSFLIFLSIALAIGMGIFLRKTNIGLSIKAIGEDPASADAVGIQVNKIKYLATVAGGSIAALGGLVYYFELSAASPAIFELEAFGWIAVALVIASLWKSELAIASSLIFAMLYLLPSSFSLGGNGPVAQLFKGLAYLITLLLLIITSILNKKELQAPASLGLSYFKEDR